MNSWLFRICIASLVAAACGQDAGPSASTPPAPKRGYLLAPASAAPRPGARAVILPTPAAPLDPADVTPDQPENVQVNP